MVHYHITVSGAQRQQHNVFQCRWLVSISVTHNRSVPTSFPDYTTYPGDMRSSAEFPNATNSLHMLLWKSFLFFNTISTVGQGKCNFFFSQNKASHQWPLCLGNNSLWGHVVAVQEEELLPIVNQTMFDLARMGWMSDFFRNASTREHFFYTHYCNTHLHRKPTTNICNKRRSGMSKYLLHILQTNINEEITDCVSSFPPCQHKRQPVSTFLFV